MCKSRRTPHEKKNWTSNNIIISKGDIMLFEILDPPTKCLQKSQLYIAIKCLAIKMTTLYIKEKGIKDKHLIAIAYTNNIQIIRNILIDYITRIGQKRD